MKRRQFVALVGSALAAIPFAARAQQPRKIPLVGIMSFGRGDDSDGSRKTIDAFMPAMRELGYVEGQNISVERKFADGDLGRLGELAQELVRQGVDVIVALATPTARAARKATSTIPIVGIGLADPVEDELAASLARPGGNVTGTSFLGPELVSKRLQLLKTLVPNLARAVVLWHPQAYGERTMAGMVKEINGAAESLRINLRFVPAGSPAELDDAFTAISADRADGLIAFPSPMLYSQYPRIVAFAASTRLPAMYAAREGVELGGLASYGANLPDLSRSTAGYLDRILKGAKPGELPIQQPTRFELVINLKTAKALGLTVEQNLLLIADEVIE